MKKEDVIYFLEEAKKLYEEKLAKLKAEEQEISEQLKNIAYAMKRADKIAKSISNGE